MPPVLGGDPAECVLQRRGWGKGTKTSEHLACATHSAHVISFNCSKRVTYTDTEVEAWGRDVSCPSTGLTVLVVTMSPGP